MNEPRILLLNADLSSAVSPQLLQGFSGKTYAVSRWCAAQNCHAVEMSLAEYEACRDDLRRAVHLMMRRWYPKFVLPERPAAVMEFERGYAAGFADVDFPGASSRAFEAGWEMGMKASIESLEADGAGRSATDQTGGGAPGRSQKPAPKVKGPKPAGAGRRSPGGRKPEAAAPVTVNAAEKPETLP